MGEKEAMLKEDEKEGTSIEATAQPLKHCTENERNHWCTENQTSNTSAKKSCKEKRGEKITTVCDVTDDLLKARGEGVTIHHWMKTSGGRNVEAVPQEPLINSKQQKMARLESAQK